MNYLIFDPETGRCLGRVAGAGYNGDGVLIDISTLSPELPLDDAANLSLSPDGVTVTHDATAALLRAKVGRKTRIKAEAARLIEATDWKLARAREREAAGWATLAEVDVVLAEREAIRRSSNAAELAVDALTDVASAQAFAWSVDVPVAAPRRLTHQQFLVRFSDAEMQAILAAQAAQPAVAAWLEKFRLAGYVNLLDPATVAGVQALEIAGLLGSGRAAEVLA